MSGAASHEGVGRFAGKQDPSSTEAAKQDGSCLPEGLLWDVSGQKSALQRKHRAVPVLAGWSLRDSGAIGGAALSS